MKKKAVNKNSGKKNTAERILNEAMKLFFQKGYHGSSIDDISRAAGLTKGALYWHFESKEALLREIVDEFETRFLDGMIESVAKVKGGALDKFEKCIRYNAAFAYYNPELCVSFTTLAGELIGARHGIEPEIRRIYKKYQEFLSRIINEGKKENIFKRELDPSLVALLVIAFHDGVLHQWAINKDKVDGKIYVDAYKRIMLSGLMA